MALRRGEPSGSVAQGESRSKAAPVKKKSGMTRFDFLMTVAGAALGVTCALFPWYIFFNQEQFGPPAMKFAGTEVEASGDDATATPILPRGNSEVRITGIPSLELDYSPTGSLPRVFSGPATPLPDQPFPQEPAPFKVIHVTAGRAMIEDDSGIWVVQRGSTLPDKSNVELIERRDGEWVVVTSNEAVLSASD